MVAGNTFDEAFSKWGSALRKYHGKSVDGIQRDVARKYLGYWTDNGAYYYYNTIPDNDYENTLMTLKKTFEEEEEKKLPVQYIEVLDSHYFEFTALLTGHFSKEKSAGNSKWTISEFY